MVTNSTSPSKWIQLSSRVDMNLATPKQMKMLEVKRFRGKHDTIPEMHVYIYIFRIEIRMIRLKQQRWKKNTKKLINGLYPIDPSRLFGLVLFNAHWGICSLTWSPKGLPQGLPPAMIHGFGFFTTKRSQWLDRWIFKTNFMRLFVKKGYPQFITYIYILIIVWFQFEYCNLGVRPAFGRPNT
jgi:hypothetical protein